MAGDKAEVLALAPKQTIVGPLEKAFTVHKLWEAPDRDAFLNGIAPRVRPIASAGGHVALARGAGARGARRDVPRRVARPVQRLTRLPIRRVGFAACRGLLRE